MPNSLDFPNVQVLKALKVRDSEYELPDIALQSIKLREAGAIHHVIALIQEHRPGKTAPSRVIPEISGGD